MMPITVAPRSGHCVFLTASSAASSRRFPRCTPVSIPSVTTIALSTSMPIAMMSAPSEIRSISRPNWFMKKIVPSTVRNSTDPTVRPARHPIDTIRTITTMATDSARLIRKSLIDRFTTTCC